MNGLALRINRGGGGKSKNSIGYSPIAIPTKLFENTDTNGNKEVHAFMSSVSTDDQLAILKQIIDTNKHPIDDVVMKFLVAAFFHAEAKHPIKCVVSRHITKNKPLEQPFSDALAVQITDDIAARPTDYRLYVDIVSKLITCIENFNAGVAALKMVELALASYLTDCLECCVKTLREQKTLSPTEKNEIFNLAHITLRLLLHITQKVSEENKSKLILMFEVIRSLIQLLIFDDDVPMDTKSVGGMLYLTMHVTEHDTDSWMEVLNPNTTNSALRSLLTLEAGRLSLYSAIATVVPAEHLFTQIVDEGPAILTLTKKILDIGERSSSESAFILGVARTALQLGKLLARLSDSGTGLALVGLLLQFTWPQLQHHMDSVRHLAGQLLACLVKYCADTDARGDSRPLETLTGALSSLERSRKSYYVCAARLAAELPARALPALLRPRHLLPALHDQHLHNTARAALEALLDKCIGSCSEEELHSEWLQPLLQCAREAADELLLGAMQHVLTRAVRVRPDVMQHVLQYIKEASEPGPQERDLKCVLMLLRVVRKSAGSDLPPSDHARWKGIISYDVLEQAAVDAADETRILSLSLIVESPKSTELFSEGELRLVLHFLEHNINAQAPNFRQLTLSAMKKFIKRLEESYKVIWRELQTRPNGPGDKVAYYLRFAEDLRRQFFDSLLPGANYSRRFVALQVLAWCEQITLEGYQKSWEPEYVEKLLLHLEDSYENNKAFALEVLASCPVELLKRKNYSISLDLEDIIRQASLLKPTECMSAAYKLDVLRMKLPEYILQDEQCDTSMAERVLYSLCARLLREARAQLRVCAASVVSGAARAPLYGLLHCLAHALRHVHPQAISTDAYWSALVGHIIDTCVDVNAAVACVVNNSSPEGHLPMDLTVQVTDHGNSGNVTLEDGRQVTAQMVLLCAWRSVKEVSLLLGGICNRLSIAGEEAAEGTLHAAQLRRVGAHFTRLLAETKHRGAFEQAYVGFTLLLDRLWRCRSPELHALPRRWLQQLLRDIADDSDALCATRRSAGLPFMIQALVTTELQVQGNPLCFHECMSSLLELCAAGRGGARGHALHVLRALLRHAALAERAAPHHARALLAALRAFDADTWAERNSSTLLLSALVSRVFGVTRSCMTGRIFFLRYPQLYDFMLDKLQQASEGVDSLTLRPSLYPVLLLLARLYPSSLEGTETNLKLVSFIPLVQACGRSAVLHTRRLAACALVPLIPPEQLGSHVQSMCKLLQTADSNLAHGVVLQLAELARRRGRELPACGEALRAALRAGLPRLRPPCYVLAGDLVTLIALLDKLQNLPQDIITEICTRLHTLIFETAPAPVSPGRDVCLSHAMSLYLIFATKYNITDIRHLVYEGLQHSSYEVVISVLDYLLTLHNNPDAGTTNYHEHLKAIDESIWKKIKSEQYIQLLCKILRNKYLECQEKSLKILMLEGDTQRSIIETKTGNVILTDDMVIEKLIDLIQNEHEKLTHIYLQCLLDFVSVRLRDSSLRVGVLLEIMRVVLDCSSAENCDNTRRVVVAFIETNFALLLGVDVSELSEGDTFELRATIWATIITLLEDDEADIRRRVTRVAGGATAVRQRLAVAGAGAGAGPGAGAGAGAAALLALVSLLDFQSVVVVADDVTDECRVFDQNERYNIFLEESVWTIACADILANVYKLNDTAISVIIDKPAYKQTFDKLCKDNVEVFRKMAAGEKLPRNDTLNPKIELFVNRLRKLGN